MSTFHCTACGRAIFRRADQIALVTLSTFGDHRASCHVIREAIEPETLRRYDVSLHEGWYCCRFIMMRMVVDKFGTGDSLLVYADSVVEVADGATSPRASASPIVKLGRRDHDMVIAATRGLAVVKHGAIWCPPCRHMDAILARIELAGVTFFELDIDEEPEIAARFRTGSIPFFVFYKDGVRLSLDGPGTVAGGIVGAIPERALRELCVRLRDRSAA